MRRDDAAGEILRGTLGLRMKVREFALATPADRDRYIDLHRAVAIVAVVLGHWLVAGPWRCGCWSRSVSATWRRQTPNAAPARRYER